MKKNNKDKLGEKRTDYSNVTPATGIDEYSMPIADSLANHLPTADLPSYNGSYRADPDKTIPGPEAATGIDHLEIQTKDGVVTIVY